ncbi:hypothetical protein, partial [Leuconostoc lactis]|uniref:hypothetical protein n=1 Tax=Leuconostoc lactis TaxID=1246 RepID=UPI001E2E9A3B
QSRSSYLIYVTKFVQVISCNLPFRFVFIQILRTFTSITVEYNANIDQIYQSCNFVTESLQTLKNPMIPTFIAPKIQILRAFLDKKTP